MKKSVACIITILFGIITLCIIPAEGAGLFVKDVDHDGFPDDLETATNYNPAVNEALKKSTAEGKCGVIKTDLLKLTRPHNVLIILDISGSMKAPLGNSTRMEVAKKVLGRYIDALPSTMKSALLIYGKSNCGEDSIELLAPMGRHRPSGFKEIVNSLQPRGQTPIALSLKKTSGIFKGIENENNHLILISDGMESCGGNPVQEILDLKESEIDPQVTVIGLGVNPATRNHLARIASSSDGSYADVNSEEDFIKAFASFFQKMNRLYKDIVCIVRQYNAYLTYETDQYNKSKGYLIKAMTKTFDAGRQALIKRVEEKIDRNHEERIRAKDKLNEMIEDKMKEMESATNKFIGKE